MSTTSFSPSVVQTYRLTPLAVGLHVNGLTLRFAGSPICEGEMFDVIGALTLAGGTQFSVCDNAIKQVLDVCPHLERIS